MSSVSQILNPVGSLIENAIGGDIGKAAGIMFNPVMGSIGAVGDMAQNALSGDQGHGTGLNDRPVINPITQAQIDEQRQNVTQGQMNQADFLRAVQAQNGLGNQTNVFNQLQGVASGTGPNPAQAMLANSTGQNVANQTAMMAGQRGASANPALIARQAAQQGANTQQQAAGQAAALQAQQQLGALNQMGGLANQQANQLAAANQAYTNAALQGQQNVNQGAGIYNNAAVGMQSNLNNNNAELTKQNNGMMADLVKNITGGVGSVLGLAEGGIIKSGPQSSYGKMMMAAGGKVPALVSPGEKYLDPKDVAKVAKGANPMIVGEEIPGKAKVGGAKNSYANDTVPKTLDEGGIVIPRSITQGKDASKKAAAFVDAILKKQSLKKG